MKSLKASEGVTIEPLAVLRVGVVTADEQKAIAVQWYVDDQPHAGPGLWHLQEDGPDITQIDDVVASISEKLYNLMCMRFSTQLGLF